VVPIEHCMVAHQQVNDIVPSLHADRGEITVRVSLATGEHTLLEGDGTAKGAPRRHNTTDSLTEVVAGASLRVSAPSFFQSGVHAAELLIHTVRASLGERVNDRGSTLDAYGGIGLFSAALPLHAPIIVEGSPSACADARVNLPQAVVEETAFERWSPVPVSTAVVDPARAGLGRDAAAVLAATGADVVALVSCDPVAMARDVALLAEHGYHHRSTQVLDLFPQTPHVEAVTVLER
jgi:23S rRNA (uracil1939-C5)-methyltransferase